MATDAVLGIDLGTTNSVVAISDGGSSRVLSDELGNRLIPSVVSFKPDGGIVVGHEARDRRLIDAENTIYSVKRLIGRPFRSPEVRTAQERFAFKIVESATGGVAIEARGESYALTEVSAFVLREVVRVSSLSVGATKRAVVTVPANFNELQRSATKAAGRVAGLDVLRIINEPTAAALAYGYGKTRPERVAVFDLGGGTFDLSILNLDRDVFEVVSTAGDSFLGGDDLDVIVANRMCDAFLQQHRWDPRSNMQAYERILAAAEWAKCQLSSNLAVDLTVEELHYGAGGRALDLEFSMSRAELEQSVRPLLGRTFDVCERALSTAGLKSKDVESVVLVGGATRMPLLRNMVSEYFGQEPRDEIDPDLVVAQGAAIHGRVVGGVKKSSKKTLGRVALKRVTADMTEALQRARSERQQDLPKQPAFAPTEQRDAPPLRPPTLSERSKVDTFRGLPRPGVPPVTGQQTTGKPPMKESMSFDELREASTLVTTQPGLDAQLQAFLADDEDTTQSKAASLGSRAQTSVQEASPLRPAPPPLRRPAPPPLRPAPPPLRRPALKPEVSKQTMRGHVPPPPPISPRHKSPVAPTGLTPASVHGAPFERSEDTLEDFEVRTEETPTFDPSFGAPLDALSLDAPLSDAASANPTSSFDAPSFDAPAFDAPSFDAPAFDAPSFDAPSFDAPSFDAPSFDAPAFDAPSEEPRENPFALPSITPPSPSAPPAAISFSERPAPLLMDVTPHSLGIETVGGYCQHLVLRNAPIPAEQSRIFSTGQDGQESVQIRICQGEARNFDENQLLGSVALSGLRPAPRGQVNINVSFSIDASGSLDVKAVDTETGKAQEIRIELLGGASEEEIQAMQLRQRELFT